jgi:general secretion pathway protein G
VKKNNKKAFSLIELIFIIAVLGIIAAVAVPKLFDSRSSAIVATVKQDVATITNAIQSYYMLNNEIENITDAVNINTNVWTVEGTTAEYKSDEDTCVTISVEDNQLTVSVDNLTNEICKKIADSGISNKTYELF